MATTIAASDFQVSGSSTVTSISKTLSASAQAGDILLITAAFERISVLPSITLNGAALPNIIRSESSSNTAITQAWKRLVAGDLGKTIQLSSSATRAMSFEYVLIRGAADPIATTQAFSASVSGTSSKTGPTATPSSDNALLVDLLVATAVPPTGNTTYGGYTWTVNSGWTVQQSHEHGNTTTYTPHQTIATKQLSGGSGASQAGITFGDSEAVKFESYATRVVFPAITAVTAVSVVATPVTTTPGQVVTAVATATGPDGTASSISSYAWDFAGLPPGVTAPTITGATNATMTFTIPAGKYGRYQPRCTVTATDATTDNDKANVFVPTDTVYPIEVVDNSGAWTSTTVSNLTDSNASTFIESPASATTEAKITYRMAPMTKPNGGMQLVIGLYLFPTVPAGVTKTARILDGDGTVRKTFTLTASGTTEQVETDTMTATECNAVVDWNQLQLQLGWTTP